MHELEYPSVDFSAKCRAAVAANYEVLIRVRRGCRKLNAVRRSIDELNDRVEGVSRLTLIVDKFRVLDFWLGIAAVPPTTKNYEYAVNGDLMVRIYRNAPKG